MTDSQKDSIHYLVTLFLRCEKSTIYGLDTYHRMILRVVADYCDMKFAYCSLKQPNLAKECGMSLAQLKKSMDHLIKNELIHRVYQGKYPRYRVGQIITGIPNEVEE